MRIVVSLSWEMSEKTFENFESAYSHALQHSRRRFSHTGMFMDMTENERAALPPCPPDQYSMPYYQKPANCPALKELCLSTGRVGVSFRIGSCLYGSANFGTEEWERRHREEGAASLQRILGCLAQGSGQTIHAQGMDGTSYVAHPSQPQPPRPRRRRRR